MGMMHASDLRRVLRSKLVKRFSEKSTGTAYVGLENSARGDAGQRFDIFGSLPRDLQIDVLGYLAVHRPVQVLLMRKVCTRWREILSEDSIYHSALLTASFSLPPPSVSFETFRNACWSDDTIRRFRLSKGRTIWYTKELPNNNVNQPNDVIYRDGFIVWWVQHGRYFNYVDLNQPKNSKKSFVVESGFTQGWGRPLYAQADGKLVFGEICEESDQRRLVHRLHVVLLRNPPRRGEITLSTLPRSSGGACEIYCSWEYVLVLNGLKLLVADIRDVTKTKVLRIIHLDEHTSLVVPVVNTIEISKNDSCLVVLTSRQAVETLIFLLKSGSLLRRYSAKTMLESRSGASGTTYHVQHNTDFARDTQYQVRNQTHKDRSPGQDPNSPNRWLRLTAGTGDGDECVTGSYQQTISRLPELDLQHSLPRHSVTFVKQAVTFTALRDSYDDRDVHRICLRVNTGNVGAEQQDWDVNETKCAPSHRHQIGFPTSERITEAGWTHKARMSTPQDCMGIINESGEYIDTTEWCRQRHNWPAHTILLGDEKALVLALPHQLVIWRFETRQMYADRVKKRLKKLALEGLLQIILVPGYLAAVVGAVPLVCAVVVWNVCSYLHTEVRRSEMLSKMRRKGD